MTSHESGWVRNLPPGQPGWFIAGYDADPGWLVTDADIARLSREQVEGMITGLPPLPPEAWRIMPVRDASNADLLAELEYRNIHVTRTGPMPGQGRGRRHSPGWAGNGYSDGRD